MKDKEKQIWQDIANVMCECEDKENFTERYRTKCRGCNLLGVIRHIVFFLNNSDYRKTDKDSVVLSKEEYSKNLQTHYFMGLRETEVYYKNIQIPKARKETATTEWKLKQFAERLKEKFYYVFGNEYEQSVSGFDTKVLIEHIDETLKEFIEK